jgi:hypothetical protein
MHGLVSGVTTWLGEGGCTDGFAHTYGDKIDPVATIALRIFTREVEMLGEGIEGDSSSADQRQKPDYANFIEAAL